MSAIALMLAALPHMQTGRRMCDADDPIISYDERSEWDVEFARQTGKTPDWTPRVHTCETAVEWQARIKIESRLRLIEARSQFYFSPGEIFYINNEEVIGLINESNEMFGSLKPS